MNSVAECPDCSCCQETPKPSDPLTRSAYADRFGPTTRDCLRLADTALRIKIEDDWSGGSGRSGTRWLRRRQGDRESMAVRRPARPGHARPEGSPPSSRAPDTVITGVVVLDHWGVVKAGCRASGTATSPRSARRTTRRRWTLCTKRGSGTTASVQPTDFVIGPDTEVIAGKGRILTAGGSTPTSTSSARPGRGGARRRCHHAHRRRHGPAKGSTATTVTPGLAGTSTAPSRRWTASPSTSGCRQGRTMSEGVLLDRGGRRRDRVQDPRGLGRDPRRHPTCLEVCRATGVQLALHADPLNEAGFVQDTSTPSTAGPSTSSRRGRRRRPRTGHDQDGEQAECAARLHQSHPATDRQHGQELRHGDGLPSP